MEVQIVEFVKSWSCKFCDALFSITNILGEDLFFYLVFFAIYWTYKKDFAFKFACVYFVNFALNFAFKNLIRRPRPTGATADGFSFPSGHSQSYSSVASGLVYEAKKNNFPAKTWLKMELVAEFIIVGVLVGLGRMYFGQHYLTDVIAGLMFGVIFTVGVTFVLDNIIVKSKISLDKFLLLLLPVMLIGYLVVTFTSIFDSPEDLAKIYRIIGIFVSVVIGHFVDKKWLHYNTDDTIVNKIIKVVAGSAVLIIGYVLFIQNAPVNALTPVYYMVLGLVATVVLPYIFKTIKNEPPKVEEGQ